MIQAIVRQNPVRVMLEDLTVRTWTKEVPLEIAGNEANTLADAINHRLRNGGGLGSQRERVFQAALAFCRARLASGSDPKTMGEASIELNQAVDQYELWAGDSAWSSKTAGD